MPISIHEELRGVQPHLLTRVEYAPIVREASQKVIKRYILARKQAEKDLRKWELANPQSAKPSNYHGSNTAYDKWHADREYYQMRWGSMYQKVYDLAMAVTQLKSNIRLSRMIEDGGAYENAVSKDNGYNFFTRFGGVNNPLLTHGHAVYNAIYQHIEVPEHVLAEWPDVEKVRKIVAERKAAWDSLNSEYANS